MSDQYASLGEARNNHSITDLSQPLASGTGWMKFVGIMSIIQGALTALTIVGILFAWLPIWIGVLVMQSAGAVERASQTGDAAALKEGLSKLRTYFVIQGVLWLVMFGIFALYIIFFGAMMATVLKNGGFPH
ncbi:MULTISPECIES: DUF5362 domain-containing protein [Dyella]|uniref:DUF5362 domain-containing protein n=2 Tax=Dyella TaxID=231454 RepID=A0A4V2NM57_9GAMM|nr:MULTISPECIES: DUF5362 domain-containing protein [Dyella]TBR40451.1 hypothetical protein EYV96_09930 [Dyella terrae]TCI11967.1 hypothetical protein EZM97_00940 [Dyella soli]